MLDCVVTKGFISDLGLNSTIDLFFISFGGSSVPLSQFTSRDFMKDLSKTGSSQTPTVIDNGWEITVKFKYTEIRKFNKVYLLYAVNNQYKLAYVFNAADFQVYDNYIKLDFSDFECNAPLRTIHKNNNIVYTHRHTEYNGQDINRAPNQEELSKTIIGLPQITSAGMNFITVTDFGLTEKETSIAIDKDFINNLNSTSKQLSVNFIDSHIIEYDTSSNLNEPLNNVDLLMVTGGGFDCSLSVFDLISQFSDETTRIGTLKFFPTRDYFNQYKDTYLECNGQEVDETIYPEYIKILGNVFNNKTPDLKNGYIRSSGYMDPITKQGYEPCSENPAQIKSHKHSYQNMGYIVAGKNTPASPCWPSARPNGTSNNPMEGSDIMVAKSFIGIWGIKAK